MTPEQQVWAERVWEHADLLAEIVQLRNRLSDGAGRAEALRLAAIDGMNAVVNLVAAHPEITVWSEWDACSRFVHDHSALVATPEGEDRK